jgi:hypothetical protein
LLINHLYEVALVTCHIAQAQHGARACSAPVGFDVPAATRLEQQVERPAVGEETIEPRLQFLCRALIEPRTEFEELWLLRDPSHSGQRVGHDLEPACRLPIDQRLRLRPDHGFSQQQAPAQLDSFFLRPPDDAPRVSRVVPDEPQCHHYPATPEHHEQQVTQVETDELRRP